MKRLLITAGLTLAGLSGIKHYLDLHARLGELESTPRVAPDALVSLENELKQLHGELDRTRARVERDKAKEELANRLRHLELQVSDADCRIDDQVTRLSSWEDVWQGLAPTLDTRLEALRVGLEERWRSLDELSTSTARMASEDRARLERLHAQIASSTDPATRWEQLMGPVVQLSGDATVGSGVLLVSRPGDEAGKWKTPMLTAWHVVRDIYGSPDNTDAPVPVKIYLEDGSTQFETAHLIDHNVKLDVALLMLDCDRFVPNGARLASRDRLEGVRVFDSIYAVGCPLGNDPIPTAGEIAATEHEVDGVRYWMISAPTYIGNSGGGIFDAETHELLSIFSKIYTHGSMRSTIVPHMGLSTPLSRVYDWLDQRGLDWVANVPPATAEEPKVASVR